MLTHYLFMHLLNNHAVNRYHSLMGKGVRRRELIAAALQQGGVASQAELCEVLYAHGIAATQATVSRDLRALGVVKTPDGYRLLHGESNGVAHHGSGEAARALVQALETFVVSARVAGNLLVLRTGPGQAQVVAVEFDRHPMPEVVGVIAGDDTIFLAVEDDAGAHDLCARVRDMAGLTESGGVS